MAGQLHRLVRAGIDPLEQKQSDHAAKAAEVAAEKACAITFAHVADEYIKAHAGGWQNAKHSAQWDMTLRRYAGPIIGSLPVADIETDQVIAVLQPLWHQKTETASRLRGRIEAVLDYAAVKGWREGANPARWRGHLDKVLPKPSRIGLPPLTSSSR